MASWIEGIWICFRACPFLGSWCALLFEEIRIIAGRGCSASFGESMRTYRRVRLETIGSVENGGHAVDGGLRFLEARGDWLSESVTERAA